MKYSRREFIITSGLAVFAAGVQAASKVVDHSSMKKSNIILGGGQYRSEGSADINYVLSILDINRGDRQLSTMSFLPHGIHRNPVNHNRLAIFEKKGPHACEFDMGNREVIRSIPTIKHRYFYGHGAYSLDGGLLYSTETELEHLTGMIGIRNSSDLAYLGEFPSYGKEPHECKLIDGGKTLVVTNGGGGLNGDAPSVAYIDVNSQQLLEKIELTNSRLNTGHLAIGPKGDLVVVSAPRVGLEKTGLGGVSIRPKGAGITSINNPAEITSRMRGEALSVAVHPQRGIAAVTHPDGGMVTFWSMKDRQLLKVIDLPHPRGVELTVDQSHFLVSFDQQANLVKIPVATLEFDSQAVIYRSYITGSHLYNWSRGMNEIYYPRA